MKLLLILLPLLVAFIAAIATIVVVGMFMPRDHTATASIKLSKSPQATWALISDFEGQPAWRTELKGVERLPDRVGHRVHKELTGRGGMTIEVEVLEPPGRMVTRIADDSLPFGGTWTFDLSPDGSGSRLRITENGFVKPAPFRYIAAIMGHDATIRKYLTAAAAHLGDRATPEP